MSWEELTLRGLVIRPWDGPKPTCAYRHSQFRTALSKTLKLLSRELDFLRASKLIVLLDVSERDIRLDGAPRANARIGEPCVAISFESKHGPLRYVTGEFATWQDNLRAIALSLEALRAVDRHGVSKSGEQYRGWRAIPQTTDPAQNMTREDAEIYMNDRWGGDARAALFATHPDHGGNSDEFRRVVRARELIGGSA